MNYLLMLEPKRPANPNWPNGQRDLELDTPITGINSIETLAAALKAKGLCDEYDPMVVAEGLWDSSTNTIRDVEWCDGHEAFVPYKWRYDDYRDRQSRYTFVLPKYGELAWLVPYEGEHVTFVFVSTNQSSFGALYGGKTKTEVVPVSELNQPTLDRLRAVTRHDYEFANEVFISAPSIGRQTFDDAAKFRGMFVQKFTI